MSFDWQTEEDVDWEDPDQPQNEPEQPRRRRPWGVILLLVLSVTAVSILIYQVVQRVSTATETVEDELLASVTVIQNAAVDGDRMLFSAFLSGRDKDWADANEQLIADELYLQRPAFGLRWLEIEPETAVISTTLSPDLRSAEVLLKYDYELDVGNGLTDTIELRQTAVYRLGENRWLLAPPESEFWGEEKSIAAGALTVTYPERDEAIAQKLAADWSAAWAGTCALFGNVCDRDFRMAIELSTDPTSFIAENGEYDPTAVLQLPTPSLVGLPQDRDGYGALYRGYLAQILRPFWQVFLVKECCGGELFYDAAVHQFLRQVSGWSVENTAVDWQTIQQNKITLHDANLLWDIANPIEENIQLATAVITFLVDGVGVSPLRILQSFSEPQEATLTEHLIAYFNSSWTAELWEREWQHFIQEQVGSALNAEELPEQDLLMLCRPDWSSKIALYRHDLQHNTTTLVQDFNYQYNDGFMIALPDDSGIVMSGLDGTTANPFLLRDNVRYDVLPDRETNLWPLADNRSGNHVLWYQFGEAPIDPMVYAILDVAACLDENDCQVQMGDIYPAWSPDGEQFIGTRLALPFFTGLNVDNLLTLHSGDGEEFSQSLVFGVLPVWLDDRRYVFVQTTNDGRFQVLAASIDQETEPELLLNVDDIARVLPETDTAEHIFVDFAFRDPHEANRLFLVIGLGSVDRFDRALVAYDLETGDLERHWTLVEPVRHPGVYKLSPDGEWLLTSSNLLDVVTEMHFHHLQSGEIFTMTMGPSSRWPNLLYTDWSAGDEWLSFPQNGMVELVAPDTEETHLVVADELYCTGAVWTDE